MAGEGGAGDKAREKRGWEMRIRTIRKIFATLRKQEYKNVSVLVKTL